MSLKASAANFYALARSTKLVKYLVSSVYGRIMKEGNIMYQ